MLMLRSRRPFEISPNPFLGVSLGFDAGFHWFFSKFSWQGVVFLHESGLITWFSVNFGLKWTAAGLFYFFAKLRCQGTEHKLFSRSEQNKQSRIAVRIRTTGYAKKKDKRKIK
jgi:hypothetical protein